MTTLTEDYTSAIAHLRDDLALVEEKVVTGYSLADAIREGSSVTTQTAGWGRGETACALSAGAVAATARGYA